MAFFNLTQLGPQNLFRTTSNLSDDQAASKFSSSGSEQKPVGKGLSGAIHSCSKVMECTPPSREALIDTTGDQTVSLYRVGKSTETTASTSKGRAEFKVKLLLSRNFIILKPLLRSHSFLPSRSVISSWIVTKIGTGVMHIRTDFSDCFNLAANCDVKINHESSTVVLLLEWLIFNMQETLIPSTLSTTTLRWSLCLLF